MKKFLIVLALLAVFLLGACSTTIASAEQTWPLKIWHQNENGGAETWNIVDEETGVNYIVCTYYLAGRPGGITVTPRLNADGTLYVSK